MAAYLKCGRAEEMLNGCFISFKAIEGQTEVCNPCLINKENYVHEKSSGLARITLLDLQDDRALIAIELDDLRSDARGYALKKFYVSKENIIEK
jgi:hypothetical protein